MKPKEVLFLAVAFFLGYFANTVINMTCGRPVVEGATATEMNWNNNRLEYTATGNKVPACNGEWSPGGCLKDAKNSHFTYASEFETKLLQCPIGEDKTGTVCCDSGDDEQNSLCNRGANGRPKDQKSCCFWKRN